MRGGRGRGGGSGGNRFVPIRRGRCGAARGGGGRLGHKGEGGMPPLVNPFLNFRLRLPPPSRSPPLPPLRLLGDGFDGLAPLGDALKGRIRVQFIDEHGAAEAGVVGVVGCVWRQSGDWVCGESGGGEGRAMTG